MTCLVHSNDTKLLRCEGFVEQADEMDRLSKVIKSAEVDYKESFRNAVIWYGMFLSMVAVVLFSFLIGFDTGLLGGFVDLVSRDFVIIIAIISIGVFAKVIGLWGSVMYEKDRIKRSEDEINRLKVEISRLRVESGSIKNNLI